MTRMNKRRVYDQFSVTLGVILAMAPASIAMAQAPDEQTDAAVASYDIVVTATRQSRSASKVPASLVAVTQETLDKQGVRDISDIARLTPSVTFVPAANLPGVSNIYIRGVESTSGIPTTGIYIDETPVQTRTGGSPLLSNPYPRIFDLDRVEVLRGPQGTLFGSGSVGGAVRFITPDPSLNEFSLYGRGETSFTQNGGQSGEVGLAAGAPIVDGKLGVRASVWYQHDGGYVDKLDRVTKQKIRSDANSGNSYVARLAVKWQPIDNLTLTPSIFFQNIRSNDTPVFSLVDSSPSKAQLRDSIANAEQYHRDRFSLLALKGQLEIGGVSLISNTSYLDRTIRTLDDSTAIDLSIFAGIVDTPPPGLAHYYAYVPKLAKQSIFTQEVRLQNNRPDARLNWVLGLFYSRQKSDDSFKLDEPFLLDAVNYRQSVTGSQPFASVEEAFGVGLVEGRYSLEWQTIQRDEEKAAFAQVDFKLTSKLTATAGIRYTDAGYDYSNFNIGPLFRSPGFLTVLKSSNESWTPKFGLSYQTDPSTLIYANAAKGVRGPGAAGPVGAACTDDADAIGIDPLAQRTITPDGIWSYELGVKSRLFGGRLAVDASAYRIDWKNVQTTLNLPLCRANTTLNVGDAVSQGFDLALSASPAPGLQLGASVSYNDAHYTTDVPGPNDTILRRRGEPLDVPPWSLTLNGELERPIGRDMRGYGRADFTYTSHNDKPLDLSSPLTNPDVPRRAATSSLNLRAGVRFDRVDISAFINNALNNHPLLSLSVDHAPSGPGNFRGVTFRPRTIGLTATIRR